MADAVVNLWLGELNPAPEIQPYFWQRLDENEKRHAGALHNEAIKARYVQVHGQLRLVLGEWLNEAPDKLRIAKSTHGKPFLPDYPGVEFNLSHTADHFVVAAAQNCQLGVDIETCKPRPNLSGLVNKCFAGEERQYWLSLPEHDRLSGFYRLWTRKEAFVKATGQGIQLGLNRCVVNPSGLSTFLRLPDGYGESRQWFIHQVDVNPAVHGALVLKTLDGPPAADARIAVERRILKGF